MIYAEYVLNGSFTVIETEILAKLDTLVCSVNRDFCLTTDWPVL